MKVIYLFNPVSVYMFPVIRFISILAYELYSRCILYEPDTGPIPLTMVLQYYLF